MEKIIAYVRKLFGKEESVDSILAPITKITSKLERHEQAQAETSRRRQEDAERARNAALAAEAARKRAAAKRAKIAETFA